MLDLIIKNGKVVDGSGLPAFVADVGVKDGVIVKVGRVHERPRAPWTQRIKLSHRDLSTRTRILMHSCCGMALPNPPSNTGSPPLCRATVPVSGAVEGRACMKLVGMFNQIEEMPHKAFAEGVEWNWETFESLLRGSVKIWTSTSRPLSVTACCVCG